MLRHAAHENLGNGCAAAKPCLGIGGKVGLLHLPAAGDTV